MYDRVTAPEADSLIGIPGVGFEVEVLHSADPRHVEMRAIACENWHLFACHDLAELA